MVAIRILQVANTTELKRLHDHVQKYLKPTELLVWKSNNSFVVFDGPVIKCKYEVQSSDMPRPESSGHTMQQPQKTQ